MLNLGLAGYNKRYLYCGCGALGDMHDSRMLCSTSLYEKIILGNTITACVMLHNLCISVRDPCLPRWRLQVKHLGLIKKACEGKKDQNDSLLNQ